MYKLIIILSFIALSSVAQERHLVLTTAQKDLFYSKRVKAINDSLKVNNVDYVPIEIKGGFWILPEVVLFDKRFDPIKNSLIKSGDLSKINVRVVLQSELITSKP